MINQISQRTLIEYFLNPHGYCRTSIQGLFTEKPHVIGILKKIALDAEDYEVLTLINEQGEEIDKKFLIFRGKSPWPIILPNQLYYDESLFQPILKKLNIKLEEEEFETLCSLNK